MERNGDIIKYEVLYLPTRIALDNAEMINETSEVALAETEDMLIYLWNLTALTNYTIFVRAYTMDGPGPYSEGVVVTTLEDLSEATTSQDTTSQDTTSQDTTLQDTTLQDTTSEATMIQATTMEDLLAVIIASLRK